MNSNTTVTTNPDPNVAFEWAKRACPEAVELADIMRRYLMSPARHWNGSRLIMAIAIARGTYSHEYYGVAQTARPAKGEPNESQRYTHRCHKRRNASSKTSARSCATAGVTGNTAASQNHNHRYP
jgi:hypothetical protein